MSKKIREISLTDLVPRVTMAPVFLAAWLVVVVMVSRLELQTNLLQSFHNHGEGPY